MKPGKRRPPPTDQQKRPLIDQRYQQVGIQINVVMGQDGSVQINRSAQGASVRTLQWDPQGAFWQALLQDVTASRTQAERLSAVGVNAEMAQPSMHPEALRPDDSFPPSLALPPPLPLDPEQVGQDFAALDQRYQQWDQQFGGVVQTLGTPEHSVDLAALRLQQGNLALWRFRQHAVRLIAEQASLYYLALPQDQTQPELQAFQVGAQGNLEVRRGWVLFHRWRTRHQERLTPTVVQELRLGRWREVLASWKAGQQITPDQAQAEQTYLEAIGESYDARDVQTNVQEAERCFAEALRRQPTSSIALMNLGAVKLESAIWWYIETGTADRARLQEGHELLAQAETLLTEQPDPKGRLALAQCLVYQATVLPIEADLASVRWAAQQTQQLRAALRQEDQARIQWEMAQRNLARRDLGFVDRKKLEHARDLLIGAGVGAGAMAPLLLLIQSWLEALPRLLKELEEWLEPGGGDPRPIRPDHPPQQRNQRSAAPRPAVGETLYTYRGHSWSVAAVAWSPDGRHLISLDRGDHLDYQRRVEVHVWDATTGAGVRRNSYPGDSECFALSPDGRYLAVVGPNWTIHMKEVLTGQDMGSCEGEVFQHTDIAWSPDGRYLAATTTAGVAYIWAVKTGDLLFRDYRPDAHVKYLTWSPDGKYLLSCGHAAGGWWHPWKRHMRYGAARMTILEVGTGREVFTYSPRDDDEFGGGIPPVRVAWSPVGGHIALGDEEGAVYVWDAEMRLVKYRGHDGYVSSLTFSPDGNYLASAGGDGLVRVWNVARQQTTFIYYGHYSGPAALFGGRYRDPVTDIAWSPDGQRIASGGKDKTVQIWQAH